MCMSCSVPVFSVKGLCHLRGEMLLEMSEIKKRFFNRFQFGVMNAWLYCCSYGEIPTRIVNKHTFWDILFVPTRSNAFSRGFKVKVRISVRVRIRFRVRS